MAFQQELGERGACIDGSHFSSSLVLACPPSLSRFNCLHACLATNVVCAVASHCKIVEGEAVGAGARSATHSLIGSSARYDIVLARLILLLEVISRAGKQHGALDSSFNQQKYYANNHCQRTIRFDREAADVTPWWFWIRSIVISSQAVLVWHDYPYG